MERTAKLFVAGDYPDKGINVTEAELDGLVSSFSEAPVKIAHTSTPFDGFLGKLSKIWRAGKDLMGTIDFSAEGWALVDAANARSLSIGIMKDKSSIKEVSLVSEPRIAGCAVFDDRIEFCTGEVESQSSAEVIEAVGKMLKTFSANNQEVKPMEKTENAEVTTFSKDEVLSLITKATADSEAKFSAALVDKDKKIANLESERILDAYTKSGKLAPACVEFAKELIVSGSGVGTITFGAETVDVRGAFLKFLDAMPEIVKFGETAPQGKADTEGDKLVKFSETDLSILDGLGVKREDAAVNI